MTTCYLSSLDSAKFGETRRCDVVRPIRMTTGKVCLVVKLSPAVSLQEFNVVDDVDTLILTSRHAGQDLLASDTPFPIFVFITRLLQGDAEYRDDISKDDLQILGWGEIYRTQDDADNHRFDKSVPSGSAR